MLDILMLVVLPGLLGALVGWEVGEHTYPVYKRWRQKKHWWYPYKSAEEAYQLDWLEACVEYARRWGEDPTVTELPTWPWADSLWMRTEMNSLWMRTEMEYLDALERSTHND